MTGVTESQQPLAPQNACLFSNFRYEGGILKRPPQIPMAWTLPVHDDFG